MANRRALVAGTTSVFAEINGSGDTLEVTNGGLISSSGSLLLAGFNNVVEVLAGDTLDVDAIDSSGAMNIGVTNTTDITIGHGGAGVNTVTIDADLAVIGNESITGTSTFTDSATFNGDVQFGDGTGTDTVEFHTATRVGTATYPNITFSDDTNHKLFPVQTASAGDDGVYLALEGGKGSDNPAGPSGTGGDAYVDGGDGGTAGGAGNAGGHGGPVLLRGGIGGGTTGTGDAGDGGSSYLVGGVGGTSSGGGANGDGGNTYVRGGSGVVDGGVFIGDENTLAINLGNGTDNPAITQTGSGQVTFSGNVDASAGLDVTGSLTVGGIAITQSGDALLLGGTGTTDAPAAVSLTTTERDLLTPVNGMFVWNETSSNFQWYDGSSWQSVPTSASAGGWTDDGTLVRLTTSSDDVAIGVAAMSGTERLRVYGHVSIGNNGDLLFENTGDIISKKGTSAFGYNVGIRPGEGQDSTGDAGAGGWVYILAGGGGDNVSASGDGGDGGEVSIKGGLGGEGHGTATEFGGAAGKVTVAGGDGGLTYNTTKGGRGGDVDVLGGTGGTSVSGDGGDGGTINITAGQAGPGPAGADAGAAGLVVITGGLGRDATGVDASGGAVIVQGGDAPISSTTDGGAVSINGGEALGSGIDGVVNVGLSTTTQINMGAAATPVVINGVLEGFDDGTGLVIGHLPSADTKGSAPVIVTVTNDTVRNYLVEEAGMMVWNAGSATMQYHDGSDWQTFSSGAASGWTDDGTVVRLTTSTDDVAIGIAAMLGTEKLRVVGDVGIQGDIDFETGAGRTVEVLKAADETNGDALTLAGGAGGDSAGVAAGLGGTLLLNGGAGGDGDLTNQGANALGVTITGGAGGANGGSGAGADGTVTIGATNTAQVTIGGAAVTVVNMPDASSSGFLVQEGANGYIKAITTNGSEAIELGNAATNPALTQLGSGQVSFAGNVDASAGLDVTGSLTVGGIAITQSGDALLLGGTGTTDAPAAVSLTTTERDLLTPVNGMFIWNETSLNFQWYDGTSWQSVPTSASAGGWTDDGTVVRLTTSTDDVAIGVATMLGTETLRVVGDVGIQGDIDFETGAARSVSVLAAADETPGNALTVSAGDGGISVTVAPGGVGGAATFVGGAGGAGALGQIGGAGGATTISGGYGGSSGGSGAGAGGAMNVLGGLNGGGATDGALNLGTSQTSAITMGGGGATIAAKLVDDSSTAFVMEQGTDDYIVVNTSNGTEAIALGNAATNPALTQLGSGQVSFAGNVDASAGLDVTTAALTAAAALTVTGGAFTFSGAAIDLDPTGNVTLDMDTGQTVDVTFADTQALGAVSFNDGTVNYLRMGEVLTEEQLVTEVYFGMDEVSAAPTAVTDRGFLYTKDASGVTELFYTDDAGTETQLTPRAASNSEYQGIAGEALIVGDLVSIFWDTGNSEARVYKTDADLTDTKSNAVGIVTLAAAGAGSATTVQLTGESPIIPNGNWSGTAPTTADAGKPVYMSQTAGYVTLTLPGGNVTVQQVGILSDGASAARKIIINVMVQLKKAA